jgi:hypothetical protein
MDSSISEAQGVPGSPGVFPEDYFGDVSSESEAELHQTISDELAHSCSYCPQITTDIKKAELDGSDTFHATFSVSVSELYEAESKGCEFLQ